MGVVKLAVGSAVVALLAAHQLSTLGPERRQALWATLHGATGPAPATSRPVAAQPLTPPQPVATLHEAAWGGEEAIAPDTLGQYQATIEIEGQRIPAMVDTGASFLVLSAPDADRLGIRPLPADINIPVSTANGRAFVDKVQLRSVRLGGIEVRDVAALVGDRGQLSTTLLGMSFLSRLSSVRTDHGRLLLAR